jgi:hypothetical protein
MSSQGCQDNDDVPVLAAFELAVPVSRLDDTTAMTAAAPTSRALEDQFPLAITDSYPNAGGPDAAGSPGTYSHPRRQAIALARSEPPASQ